MYMKKLIEKVFIYLRKSRRDEVAEKKAKGTSDTLARHRKILTALARKKGWQIVEIFEEVISGESIEERDEIKRMLARVEAEEVDAVLVMDTDRLGRGDMHDSGRIERAFKESETLVITPTEEYDPTSETWELMWSVKSLVAREELKSITKRMQRGRMTSLLEGKSISKKPAFGYVRDENLQLHPCEKTAWVVKHIFKSIAEGGSRRGVAQELNDLGAPTPSGGQYWNPSSVVAVVQNEVYIGWTVWGKFTYPKKGGKRIRKKMTPDKWTIVEDTHEPLVSRELFAKANQGYHNRWSTSVVKERTIKNPLAGVITCSLCGKRMVMQTRKGKKPGLKCGELECKGKQRSVLLEAVEGAVLGSLHELLEQLEYKPRISQDVDPLEIAALKMQKEVLEHELEKIRKRADRIYELYEDDKYTAEVFQQRMKANADDELKALSSLAVVEAKLSEMVVVEGAVKEEDLTKLRTALRGYKYADIESKNKFFKSVIKKAVYTRKPDQVKPGEFTLDIETYF